MDALCSIILLDKVTPAIIFEEFLHARSVAIHSAVNSNNNNKSNSSGLLSSISEQLCSVVSTIQFTLYYIHIIFHASIDSNDSSSSNNSSNNKSLLSTMLSQEEIKTIRSHSPLLSPSLLSSLHNNTPSPNNNDHPLSIAQQQQQQQVFFISLENIRTESIRWLKESSDLIQKQGKQLLQQVNKAQQLKEIEQQILDTIYFRNINNSNNNTSNDTSTTTTYSNNPNNTPSLNQTPSLVHTPSLNNTISSNSNRNDPFPIPWENVSISFPPSNNQYSHVIQYSVSDLHSQLYSF